MEQARPLPVYPQVIVVPATRPTDGTFTSLAGGHEPSPAVDPARTHMTADGRTARIRDPSAAARRALELCGLTHLVEP
jgi:hypothetical protein